jgi:hypothetical protein
VSKHLLVFVHVLQLLLAYTNLYRNTLSVGTAQEQLHLWGIARLDLSHRWRDSGAGRLSEDNNINLYYMYYILPSSSAICVAPSVLRRYLQFRICRCFAANTHQLLIKYNYNDYLIINNFGQYPVLFILLAFHQCSNGITTRADVTLEY